MEGEMRGEAFFRAAAERVSVRSVRVAQICAVDTAVRVENLGKPHADADAGRAFYFQSDPTNHVLAHVEDVYIVGERDDALRADGFDDFNGSGHLARQRDLERIRDQGRRPVAVVEIRLIPSG